MAAGRHDHASASEARVTSRSSPDVGRGPGPPHRPHRGHSGGRILISVASRRLPRSS
jgi:hypothetical protein